MKPRLILLLVNLALLGCMARAVRRYRSWPDGN